jgi:asparagine synthetase B (glutamine-hydrolysing)
MSFQGICSGTFCKGETNDFFRFEGEIWNATGMSRKLVHMIQEEDLNGVIHECKRLFESGCSWLTEIDGAFLFAFYDSERKRGILYKSLLCQKTLYLSRQLDTFLFSSRIGDVLYRSIPLLKQVNKDALIPLCLGEEYHPTYSCFELVKKIPAGHIVIYEDGDAHFKKLDQLQIGRYKGKTLDDYVHMANEILDRTVQKRLRTDEPVGVVLSGGMDSSSVCAYLKHRGIPVYAYHWFFKGIPAADESEYASLVSDHLKVPLIKINTKEYIEQGSYLSEWKYLLPYNHGYFAMFKKTKQLCQETGISVLATGNLGDTIFGSNDSISIRSIFRSLPIKEACRYLYEAWGTPKIDENNESHPRFHWYAGVLTDDALKQIKHFGSNNVDPENRLVSASDIDKNLILDDASEKPIRFFDLFSSRELMEWSLSVPTVYKVLPSGGQWVDKFIQRVLFIDLLPPKCISRNYKQVMTAFHEEYVLKNKTQIISILDEESFLAQFGVVDPEKIKAMDTHSFASSYHLLYG